MLFFIRMYLGVAVPDGYAKGRNIVKVDLACRQAVLNGLDIHHGRKGYVFAESSR
jgi:hypothetical protein